MRAFWVKTAIVLAPFLAFVLALRAVGPRIAARMTPVGLESVWTGERVEMLAEPDSNADALGPPTERFLESVLRTYGGRWDLRPDAARVRVLWFESEEDFLRHGASTLQQDLVRTSGYYSPSRGEVAIVSALDPVEDRRSLRHEMTHLVTDRWLSHEGEGLPIWLVEGLAVVMEDCEPQPDGTLRTRFRRDVWRGRIAKWEEFSSAGRILSLRPADFRGRGNENAYAASALFVGFLLFGGGDAQDRTLDALVRIGRRGTWIDAGTLESASGVPIGDLERAWRRWVAEEGATSAPRRSGAE